MRNIISLGHSLNLHVTAEGIETENQLDELGEMECDRAQGFLLARPLPANEIERMLGTPLGTLGHRAR